MTGIRKGVADTDVHVQGHLSLRIRNTGRRITITVIIIISGIIILIIHDHEALVSRCFPPIKRALGSTCNAKQVKEEMVV
uniref:Putative ovule protein n=1 Tax=Solanum chacoense TaxID=4108 RepID=A0A0V0GG72_SOLCH